LRRSIVLAGIAIVAIAKILIVKYLFFDQPAYEKCLAGNSPPGTISGQLLVSCGQDPILTLIIGWVVVAVGAVVLIMGLRADSIPRSRYV
jgi:hypothetical protein